MLSISYDKLNFFSIKEESKIGAIRIWLEIEDLMFGGRNLGLLAFVRKCPSISDCARVFCVVLRGFRRRSNTMSGTSNKN